MKRRLSTAAIFVFLASVTAYAEPAADNQSNNWSHGPYDRLQPGQATLYYGSPTPQDSENTSTNFGGIGVRITPGNQGVTVEGTVPGSPAADAGLCTGDVILEIDGLSTTNLSLRDFVARTRGEPGSTVSLKVRRAVDGLAYSLQLKRQIITLPIVPKSEMRILPVRPPGQSPDQTAVFPFAEARKAVDRAFDYIDRGKIQYKDVTVTRDDVEPLSVSYNFDRPEREITVNFRVKSTVQSNYFELVYGIVSVNLDDQGYLLSQSTGEAHGGVPTKQWKIAP